MKGVAGKKLPGLPSIDTPSAGEHSCDGLYPRCWAAGGAACCCQGGGPLKTPRATKSWRSGEEPWWGVDPSPPSLRSTWSAPPTRARASSSGGSSRASGGAARARRTSSAWGGGSRDRGAHTPGKALGRGSSSSSSVMLWMPARVVMGTLGPSPFIMPEAGAGSGAAPLRWPVRLSRRGEHHSRRMCHPRRGRHGLLSPTDGPLCLLVFCRRLDTGTCSSTHRMGLRNGAPAPLHRHTI